MKMMTRCLPLLFLLVRLSAASAAPSGLPPAGTGDPEAARAALDEAAAAFKGKQFDVALAAGERAWTLWGDATALETIAVAALRVNQAALGEQCYEAIVTDPGAPPAMVKRAQNQLDALRKQTGLLTVTTTPSGARILLNGRFVGTSPTPAPLRSFPGKVKVEVEFPSGEKQQQSVDAAAGRARTVEFQAKDVAAAVAVVPAIVPVDASPTDAAVVPPVEAGAAGLAAAEGPAVPSDAALAAPPPSAPPVDPALTTAPAELEATPAAPALPSAPEVPGLAELPAIPAIPSIPGLPPEGESLDGLNNSEPPLEGGSSPTEVGATAETLPEGRSELERMEGDLLTFGVFPNSSGFMDAKLYARKTYLKHFSSGVYFDYTTQKAEIKDGDKLDKNILTREYRVDVDLFKGIVPLHTFITDEPDPGVDRSLIWSVEPGVAGKYIHDGVEITGYKVNGTGRQIFDDEEKTIDLTTVAVKLDTTVAVGAHFTFDGTFEYLPYVYSHEEGMRRTRQFPDEPIDYDVKNATSGLQANVDLTLHDTFMGKFLLRGRLFRHGGEIGTKAHVVTGNFRTTIETDAELTEQKLWIELYHTMTYLKPYTFISPAIALGLQRNRIELDGVAPESDTFKVGLLAEFF